MLELLYYISYVLQLYIYVLVASAIFSWLLAFNVVNPRNQFVASVARLLYAITEPVLRPIRNILPYMGGIDLSPVVVILIIVFIQTVIIPNVARAVI
jgi:YggT family protein